MALVTALTGGLGLVVIGTFMFLIARLSSRGELPLNNAIGLRTKETKRSEAAWVSGHHAAEPDLRVAAVICVPSVMLAIILAVALNPASAAANTATLFALLAGYTVVIGLLLRAVRSANRAARRV